jgi:hydroxypyruvate isomerase
MTRSFPVGICIEPLFPELPMAARIGRVAELGFGTVEFWDPADKDLPAIRQACAAAGVSVSDCTLAASWDDGRLDGDPERVLASFARTVPMMKQVGATRAIALAGNVLPDRSAAEHRKRVVENLRCLAPIAAREGITIILEALNSFVDHPGYFLDSARAGFEIVRDVGSAHVKLLFDIYHMQIMEGNIIETVTKNIDLIGHFHAAGVPGRHELFFGELDYRHILEAIEAAGYSGAFGLEYWPVGDHVESLRRTVEFLS